MRWSSPSASSKPPATASCARTSAMPSWAKALPSPRWSWRENWSRTMISATRPAAFSRQENPSPSATRAWVSAKRSRISRSNSGFPPHQSDEPCCTNQNSMTASGVSILTPRSDGDDGLDQTGTLVGPDRHVDRHPLQGRCMRRELVRRDQPLPHRGHHVVEVLPGGIARTADGQFAPMHLLVGPDEVPLDNADQRVGAAAADVEQALVRRP